MLLFILFINIILKRLAEKTEFSPTTPLGIQREAKLSLSYSQNASAIISKMAYNKTLRLSYVIVVGLISTLWILVFSRSCKKQSNFYK